MLPTHRKCLTRREFGVYVDALRQVRGAIATLARKFRRLELRLGAEAGKVGPLPEVKTLHVENARKGFFEPEQPSCSCPAFARLPETGGRGRIHHGMADQERIADAPVAA